MIGLQRGGGLAVATLLLGLGVGTAAAWLWQANAYSARLASQAAAYQADLSAIANAAAVQARQALEAQQRSQQALAQLDRKYTQEKDKAHAENKSLRHAVADGTRRLRIAGACEGGSRELPAATGTAGLGDAGTVELAAGAGRRILDIRAGVIADQAALRVLQAYVSDVCLSG
ncbi:lysis system i-spanin subunit Rz [Pseudomonas ovata]|uniref:lysis system i-spanin subunit Rz n=1 Tax=Pseudomonas ovata TaxID=1839709 RepID=UPI0019D45DD5|nr:lysis system i-spanin subunit Rz [Pseudomonas ovata]